MKKLLAILSVFLVVACRLNIKNNDIDPNKSCPEGQLTRKQQFDEKKMTHDLLNNQSWSGLPECLDPKMMGTGQVACYKKVDGKISIAGFYTNAVIPNMLNKSHCVDKKVVGCEDGSCDTDASKL